MKNQIRFFEFPQVFISLDSFDKSKNYFKRHLHVKCPDIYDMIPDLDLFLEECRKPQTVKIQYLKYITGNESTYSTTDALEILKGKLVVRPCKISTIARILLADLGTLPDFVMSSDFCLALLPRNNGYFQINFKNSTGVYDKVYDQSIQSTTPLIMETDPV